MEENKINNINPLDSKRHPSETFEQYKLRLKMVQHVLKQHFKYGYTKK